MKLLQEIISNKKNFLLWFLILFYEVQKYANKMHNYLAIDAYEGEVLRIISPELYFG